MDQPAKHTFNFVNLSHPNELKDGETRLRIRRLAMSEVGRARRKPKTKRERNEIVFKLREKSTIPTIEWLGGGEVDPFAPYPIDLDEMSRALIASSEFRLEQSCKINIPTTFANMPQYFGPIAAIPDN